jgi:SAM-dependent methyltransferase
MIRYYSWALTEKALSYLPFGKQLYYGLGALYNQGTKGTEGPMQSAINIVNNSRKFLRPGAVILDVGTGWYHHEPFLFYLLGDYRVCLFDIKDKSTFRYIRNYLDAIRKNIRDISAQLGIDPDDALARLAKLDACTTRGQLYQACGFIPVISRETDSLFLPENSIDLMVSNCVLNHIPREILLPELKVLREILKPDGRMHFLIGHDDHWTFYDRRENQFNYYRYSDRYYRLIFETKLQFQNRLVKAEWLSVFNDCGLIVDDYHPHITENSIKEIRKLRDKLDPRFSIYPDEELAIIHSYVTLKK